MTGNNKVWRAPVAGLASVAMLATMGVATANAATVNAKDAKNITVQVGKMATTVVKGMTYADAIAQANSSSTLNAGNDRNSFGGYVLNGAFVDMDAVASDATLQVNRLESDYVQVRFVTDDGDGLGYVRVAKDSNGDFSVPEALRPYDAATDRKILNYAKATYSIANTTTQNAEFAFGNTYDVNDQAGMVTVTIPTTKADLFVFHGDDVSGLSDEEFKTDYTVTYAGAIADGSKDSNLSVEIPADAKTYDPQTGTDALIINLKNDKSYGLDKWMTGGDTVEYTADYQLGDGDAAVWPCIKRANAVKFFDGETELKDLEQAVLTDHLVSDPGAYDRGDGSTFVGWYKSDGTQWDFAKDTIPVGGVSLYSKFVDDGSYTVTYKFNDGATEDETVTYLANQVVARPDAPTRDGYLFAGWYKDDGDGMLDNGDTAFTAFGSALNADTVLIAKWIRANDATLAAAFEYVDGSDESNNAKDAKYDGIFTEASFKEYVKAYQAVQKEYAKAQDEATAAGTQIPEATLSNLVSELTAAWQNLEFVHEGDTPTGNAVVHRLSNGADHFYTQDLDEVKYMVDYQGWTDEGRLFQTAPRSDKDDYFTLASFKKAAGNDAAVEATLDAVADPILTPVTRLYNRANGDHVWSTDANEVEVLSAQADWNNEKTAFYVPTYTGSQPVTRLYKANRHLLSTDGNEVKVLSAQQGWTDEGTAFKAY